MMTTTKTVYPKQIAMVIKEDMTNWSNKVIDRVSKSLYACGFLIEKAAKRRCPVKTGTLRDGITAVKLDDETVEIRDSVTYGVFVEFGTSKMEAQPFLRPAVYSTERERKRIILEAVHGHGN